MTILWDTDKAASDHYSVALGPQITIVESGSAVTRTLVDSPDEQLVVIGPDIDISSACQVSEAVRVDRPEVGVVILRRRVDVTVLALALRSGAREVVPVDDLTALADAARHSRELTLRLSGASGRSVHKSGRIVTVFSAKGGVGKTTVSVNLAAHLALSGSRTLLVDLDLAFGDVAISLHLDQDKPRTMEEAVSMTGHLDEQGLRSIITRHEPTGLDVVCAPTTPSGMERIPAAIVAEILRVARHLYDFVIIDSPPAITEHVLASFDLSDSIVLIATLDIPALKNLRVTLETLDLLGSPPESRVVVLNRSDAKVGLTAEDVVTAIKTDIAVMIPGSVDVPAAVNRGNVLTLDQPKHPVSLAIRELADRHLRPVSTEIDATPASRPEPKASKRLLTWGAKR